MSATNTATDARPIAKIEFASTDFPTTAAVHRFLAKQGHDVTDYRVFAIEDGFLVCDADIADPAIPDTDPHPVALAKGVVVHRGALEETAALTINAPSPAIVAPGGSYGQPALTTKSAMTVQHAKPRQIDTVSAHGALMPSIGMPVAKSDGNRIAALPAQIQALAKEFSLEAECAEAVNKVSGGNAVPDDFSPYVLAILGARGLVDIRRNGQMGTPTVELSASIRNRVPAAPAPIRTDIAALTKATKSDAAPIHRSLVAGLLGAR